jgi:hypothetical protein
MLVNQMHMASLAHHRNLQLGLLSSFNQIFPMPPVDSVFFPKPPPLEVPKPSINFEEELYNFY